MSASEGDRTSAWPDHDPDAALDAYRDLHADAEQVQVDLLEADIEAVQEVFGAVRRRREAQGQVDPSVRESNLVHWTGRPLEASGVDPSNPGNELAGLAARGVRGSSGLVERVDDPAYDPAAGPQPPEDPDACRRAFSWVARTCPRCRGSGQDRRRDRAHLPCRRCGGAGRLEGARLESVVYDERDPTRTPLLTRSWGPGRPLLLEDPVDQYHLHAHGTHLRYRLEAQWVLRSGDGQRVLRRAVDRPWGAPLPKRTMFFARCQDCREPVLEGRGFLLRVDRSPGAPARPYCSPCTERRWPGVPAAAARAAARANVYAYRHGRIVDTDPCPCGAVAMYRDCCSPMRARMQIPPARSEREPADDAYDRRARVVEREAPSLRQATIREYGSYEPFAADHADPQNREYMDLVGARKRLVLALRTDQRDPVARSLAKRINDCMRWWQKVTCVDCHGSYISDPLYRCGVRICPLCNRERAARSRARLADVVRAREAAAKAAGNALNVELWTLSTLPNVARVDKGTWRGLHRSFRRTYGLVQALRPGTVQGAGRCVEPAWDDQTRTHHPHTHALVEADGSTRQAELSDLAWVASRFTGYNAHVSAVSARGRISALAEVAKGLGDVSRVGSWGTLGAEAAHGRAVAYLTEAQKLDDVVREIADPRVLLELNASLKGVHMMDFVGSWRKAARKKAAEAETDAEPEMAAVDPEEAEQEPPHEACRECGGYTLSQTCVLHGAELVKALRAHDGRAPARRSAPVRAVG